MNILDIGQAHAWEIEILKKKNLDEFFRKSFVSHQGGFEIQSWMLYNTFYMDDVIENCDRQILKAGENAIRCYA